MSDQEIHAEEIEARLVRIEEILWFQEKKLDELDAIVREFQQEQSLIIHQLDQTKLLTNHLRELLDVQSPSRQGIEEPPPHYQQSK